MATLESQVLSLEDCLKLEDKILALGGGLTVLENHYRQLVERHPDVGGGAELIDGLGLVIISPRLASKVEFEAGGCSPSEALSFFGDCILGVTLFSDWTHDGSLCPSAKTALAPDLQPEFGLCWRRQFAHPAADKIPKKFRLDNKFDMSMPGICLMQRKSDRSSGDDLDRPWTRSGSIMMSAQMNQEYWKLHPDEMRMALERIRHLPEEFDGWEDATFTDGGDELWGRCRLPHHDSADDLIDKLCAAAKHCFGDGLSTMEHLSFSLEPDEDHSVDRSRAAVEKLLADLPTVAWSHWVPHNGGVSTARKLSSLREDISRFPMVFEGKDGVSILISGLEFSGENLVFHRLYKRGGNVVSIDFLRRRKINPAVHQELEKLLGLALSSA
jgi:hypothetical protein